MTTISTVESPPRAATEGWVDVDDVIKLVDQLGTDGRTDFTYPDDDVEVAAKWLAGIRFGAAAHDLWERGELLIGVKDGNITYRTIRT